jgi:hypothetical protein
MRFPFSFWKTPIVSGYPFLSQILATSSIPGTITTAFLNTMAAANPVQVFPTVEGTYLAGQNCASGEICLLALAVPLGNSWVGYNEGSPFSTTPSPYSSPANFTYDSVVYSMQVFTIGAVGIGTVSWLIQP